MRFDCQRCGACCTGAPGYVWIETEDVAAIARKLGLSPPDFLVSHTRDVDGRLSLSEEPDGRCVLFEGGSGCRAYDVRPRQCRTWPFWARIVGTPAAWEREAADCPGMGQGAVFGPEEIERLARSPEASSPAAERSAAAGVPQRQDPAP